MSLLAVLAVMTLFALALLAVAPTVQQEIQREKELEAIRRGEEIAEAIKEYLRAKNCQPPTSIDDLLEGIPQGTKKRQILRPSAAIDPLSEDGEWLLVKATPQAISSFARRVQNYNNGVLPDSSDGSGAGGGPPGPGPANQGQCLNRFAVQIANVANTQSEDDTAAPADETDLTEYSSGNTPFIGVVSASKSKAVIAYYGIENHSKWVFTPLFRGSGSSMVGPADPNSPVKMRTSREIKAPGN